MTFLSPTYLLRTTYYGVESVLIEGHAWFLTVLRSRERGVFNKVHYDGD